MSLGIYLTGLLQTATPPVPNRRSGTATPSQSKEPSTALAELADLVVGSYYGEVVSDSKGGARSDVAVTISKLAGSKVRVSSDYSRLGTVDVVLTRSGNMIMAADGDSPLIVDLDRNPPTLDFTPRNEVAYRGKKQ